MRRRILIIFTLLLLGLNGFAQLGWQGVYPYNCGSTNCENYIVEIEPTDDGGFVALEHIVKNVNPNMPWLQDTSVAILRIDANGFMLWRKDVLSNSQNSQIGISLKPTPDGGYVLNGFDYGSQPFNYLLFAMKFDHNGDSLWHNTYNIYTNSSRYNHAPMIITSDSSYIISSKDKNASTASGTTTHIYKLNAQGDTIWTTSYPNAVFESILPLANNEFYISGYSLSTGDFLTVKYDGLGNVISTHVLDLRGAVRTLNNTFIKNSFFYDGGVLIGYGIYTYDLNLNPIDTMHYPFAGCYVFNLGNTVDSNILITGPVTHINGTGSVNNNVRAIKINENRQVLWHTIIPYNDSCDGGGLSNIYDIGLSTNGFNVVAGDAQGISAIWRFDDNGKIFYNELKGTVYRDDNNNCLEDSAEVSLENWIVEIENNGLKFYHLTDSLGNFRIDVGTGTYQIQVFPPYNSNLWSSCQGIQMVNFNNSYDTTSIKFGMQAMALCPSFAVNISTPRIRTTQNSFYYVNYCNYGTDDAVNGYVEVEIDNDLTYISSSIPWSSQVGNLFRFPINTVNWGKCGNFSIEVQTKANAVLGQTHCTEAHIYPDNLCAPILNWNGAEVKVSGECLTDSIRFKIENIGIADMSQSKNYFVIEDHVITLSNPFQLNQGDSIIITIPTTGKTFRLTAEQENNHPYSYYPTVGIELCTNSPNPSLGFINDFPFDDAAPFLSVDCTGNIGSYDPNDKQTIPEGWNEEHFILQNTAIDYKIRFQNTGTDTAFTVVIKDIIDTDELDLTTLQLGASSHNYQATIEGQNVLVFTFNNIMLPDSNVNEAASHGFVKFKIQQKIDNPLGSLIENTAAIYFDNNAPIITNTVFHTVGQMPFFVKTDNALLSPETTNLKVYPNPFLQQATFELTDKTPRNLDFTVFDAMGRMVHQEHFNQTYQFEYYRNGLASGLYFFTVMENGQMVGKGKIVIR